MNRQILPSSNTKLEFENLFLSLDMNCTSNVIQSARFLKNQIDARMSKQNRFGGDLYTITVLSAFAALIVILLYMTIRPNHSLDEQVTIMLSSLQTQIEMDEMNRHRMRIKEDKKRMEEWMEKVKRRRSIKSNSSQSSKRSQLSDTSISTISEIVRVKREYMANEHCLRIPSFTSDTTNESDNSLAVVSIQSAPDAPTPNELDLSLPTRSNSHLGFVPDIVVTCENRKKNQFLMPPTLMRRGKTTTELSKMHDTLSRKSSGSSCASLSPSLVEEVQFNFPESDIDSLNESPPYYTS